MSILKIDTIFGIIIWEFPIHLQAVDFYFEEIFHSLVGTCLLLSYLEWSVMHEINRFFAPIFDFEIGFMPFYVVYILAAFPLSSVECRTIEFLSLNNVEL